MEEREKNLEELFEFESYGSANNDKKKLEEFMLKELEEMGM